MMSRMQLVILLDRLENIIENSTRVPLTGRVIVDRDEVLDILDEIRMSMPEEIDKAEWIMKERDKIIAEAQKEAQDVVRKAQDYIGRSITESDIVKQAREQAQKILDEAKDVAHELRHDAEAYTNSQLEQLELALSETLSVVKRGREVLMKRKESD
jgi:cell division septum initiation protein DivIVA